MHIAYIQIFNDVIKMKRLFVIIKILLFTSVGFGCPSIGLISNIQERTQFVTIPEQIVMMKVNDSYITQNYQHSSNNLSANTCSFIDMNKSFMISNGENHVKRCDEFIPNF